MMSEKATRDELLIRVDERVAEILRRMDGTDANYAQLSSRVTVLENFRWFILGGSAFLGFIAGNLDKVINYFKGGS